ncbi:MAG: hypothetical protein V8R49_00920 [Duodenibacillus massiliensis]
MHPKISVKNQFPFAQHLVETRSRLMALAHTALAGSGDCGGASVLKQVFAPTFCVEDATMQKASAQCVLGKTREDDALVFIPVGIRNSRFGMALGAAG